ncbi:unnamed protein product, partial [Rotaria sordida]
MCNTNIATCSSGLAFNCTVPTFITSTTTTFNITTNNTTTISSTTIMNTTSNASL